jgi:hypothetical protein
MTPIRSRGERFAKALVIAGFSFVWSGVMWLAATSIWG